MRTHTFLLDGEPMTVELEDDHQMILVLPEGTCGC